MGQYDAIAGPGGEVAKIATELAGLNKTISSFITNGDIAERPDGPPRPAARQALAATARSRSSSSPAARPTSPSSTATTGTSYPIVADQTATWAGPPAGGWSPGRRDGRPAERRQVPGRHDRRLPGDDRLVHERRSPTSVNARLRRRLLHHRHARRAPRSPSPPRSRPRRRASRSGTGASGSNDLALAVSQLRGNAAHRRRLQGVRRQGRRRPQRGHAHAGQRPGARRLGRGPPPERGGRLDGRGDVQPRALPARLPGLRPRHVDDGRDARRPHQPHRKGRAL